MNTTPTTSIEMVRFALRDAHCDSYIEDLDDDGKSAYLKDVAKNIDDFRMEYGRRFGEVPDPLEFLKENPEKGASFIQWIAGENLSFGVMIMIWRILFGAEILSLTFNYVKDNSAELVIELEPLAGAATGTEREVYRSEDAWDFHLLAEFRMLLFNHKPYLVGSFRPA